MNLNEYTCSFLSIYRCTLACWTPCWLLKSFLRNTVIGVRYPRSSILGFRSFTRCVIYSFVVLLIQDILCNDCERKGRSRFHWLYHKCGSCGSYNTRVIKTDTADCSTPNQWGIILSSFLAYVNIDLQYIVQLCSIATIFFIPQLVHFCQAQLQSTRSSVSCQNGRYMHLPFCPLKPFDA